MMTLSMHKNTSYHLDPVLWIKDCLEFEPDTWQEKALRFTGQKMILNCCRQSGKSTTAAALALHRAIFFPNSLILLISASQRQSAELFRIVTTLLEKLPDQPRRTENNRLSLTFENNSRVVSLPSSEQTVRGFSGPDMIICDEASRISDDLFYSLRPMLAVSQGKLLLLSTPFGKRGFFFDEFTGDNNYMKITITADDCPRISEEFIKSELDVIGKWWVEQEYFCQFKQEVTSLFTYEEVNSALDYTIEPMEVN